MWLYRRLTSLTFLDSVMSSSSQWVSPLLVLSSHQRFLKKMRYRDTTKRSWNLVPPHQCSTFYQHLHSLMFSVLLME
ncbi:hypothetical protein Lser_V15G31933 [Lactuca serriola]